MIRQIILDTETTGLDPNEGDRIVEIGAIELNNYIPTKNFFHVYLNPEKAMPLSAFKIHGLSNDFLQDKPKFSEIVDYPVDLLINNAGVPDGRWRNIKEIDDKWMLEVIDINSVGPVRMVKAFYDKMAHERLATVVMISSLMGSIDDCQSGRSYAYRASKTALNMLSVAMKKEGLEDNISFLILHPGWVKTRMGGEHAPVELDDSVNGMMELIYAHSLTDSGRFVQYDGVDLPW